MTTANEHTPLIPPLLHRQSSCFDQAESDQLANLPVYDNIHEVYKIITKWVDIPVTEEKMKSPDVQINLIVPVEEYLAEMDDPSIVYVLFVCRLEFLRQRNSFLASSSLNESRATLCEVLAIRLLRHQGTGKDPNTGLLAMSRALVGGLHAFQGASDEVLSRVRLAEGHAGRVMAQGAGKNNALELAILTKSRIFLKSRPAQRVITAIWEGKVVYSSSSFLDILPDKWKTQEIGLYNIAKAPLLDHYRLRVPKYRAMIDLFNFCVLFVSFLAVILDRQNAHERWPVSAMTLHEWWFFIYALGYSLDKVASVMEHGWAVYSAGLTNGLDALCLPIFATAFGFRFHSVIYNDPWSADQCFAVLSVAACFLFPRLVFATMTNNVMILSLRAMLGQFLFLMAIAVFCFGGFVFALRHLCDGDFTVARISEWLVFIWFGLDGSGIDASPTFHPFLGPALFVVYAALSNTLLVSLLVAILSDTYSKIASDEIAEDMFRKAVMTFEGVKADSLFDYLPPVNLLALTIMWPVSYVTNPRWFHKINVAATRVFSLPILLLIAFYERGTMRGGPLRTWAGNLMLRLTLAMPAKWAEKLSMLEGAHWECEAVFEYSPSGDEKEEEEEEDVDEFGGGLSDTEDEMVEECGEGGLGRGKLSGRASRIINRASRPDFQAKRLTSYGSAREGAGTPVPSEGSGAGRSRMVSGTGEQAGGSGSTVPSTVGSPTKPVAVPEPSTSRAKSPAPFPTIESEDEPSPPPSPRAQQTHRARFASNAKLGHERLPFNATSAGDKPRRRQTRSPDRMESALSTSAPTKYDSPLARLYQPHSHEDAGLSGLTGGGGGGGLSQSIGAAGAHGQVGFARRRTMSMVAPPGQGGAFSGRLAQSQGGGGVGGAVGAEVAEQLGQMRRMMEGLVGAVERLEGEVRELKRGKGREGRGGGKEGE